MCNARIYTYVYVCIYAYICVYIRAYNYCHPKHNYISNVINKFDVS